MSSPESVIIRASRESDLPFIYRSILLGTYHGNRPGKGAKPDPRAPIDFFSSIPQDAFMASYHTHLEALFAREGVKISVACLNSDNDVILGFSVYSDEVLHFVFIKPQWRRMGFATALVPKTVKSVSGFTRVGDIIRRKKDLEFNPFL